MDIVIVDDEPLARHRLQKMVQDLGHEVLAEAGNSTEAEQAIRLYDPSLVLLDIEMPGENGLQLASKLARYHTPPAIIFTTAYDQYALNAFDTLAVAYLLKPVNRENLKQALEKAGTINKLQLESAGKKTATKHRDHIPVKSSKGVKLIDLADIRYFRAEQKYVTVATPLETLLIDETLKDLEQEFAGQFIRIHRNTLVAIQSIQGLHKDPQGHWYLQLADSGEKLMVSRRYLGETRALLAKL